MLTGTVKDIATGQPVGGVPVTLAFQGQGVANPTAITAADGTYAIGPVPDGPLRQADGQRGRLRADLAGRHGRGERLGLRLLGGPRLGRRRAAARRSWPSTDRTTATSAAGPPQALDLSLATGWGSTTGNSKGTPTNVFVPKHLTVDMKRKVNITSFAVDPSATCGDAGSSSTGRTRSRPRPTTSPGPSRPRGTFTAADRGRLNTVTPTTGSLGVQYVRFTILGNQVPDFATNCPNGAYDGCTYTDLTELQVYGVATP